MAEVKARIYHKQADIDITEQVIKDSGIRCNNETQRENLFENLVNNSQTSLLSTKYSLIRANMEREWEQRGKRYTEEDIKIESSKAYMYAKLGPTNFGKIKPKIDSKDALTEVMSNYESGFQFIQEAVFLSMPDISRNVKGKMAGINYVKKYGGTIQETATMSNPQSRIKDLLSQIVKESKQLNTLVERIQQTNGEISSIRENQKGKKETRNQYAR